MELIGDFHLHTKWCGHASGEMEEYVARALELSLPAMGFTAHFPVRMPHVDKVCLEPHEVELFVKEIRRLQDVFEGKIDILMGFEVDFSRGCEDRIREECLDRWKPDYVMGSMHVIEDWPFDHPAYIDRYEGRDIAEMYRTYFSNLKEIAASGLFDVLGHIDLVKKFGYRPDEDVSASIDELLDAVAEAGMLIEANTSGFDKPAKEMYASPGILKAACDRGIGITVGSDSHAPEQVGRHFQTAAQLISQAGYRDVERRGRLPYYL